MEIGIVTHAAYVWEAIALLDVALLRPAAPTQMADSAAYAAATAGAP